MPSLTQLVTDLILGGGVISTLAWGSFILCSFCLMTCASSCQTAKRPYCTRQARGKLVSHAAFRSASPKAHSAPCSHRHQ